MAIRIIKDDFWATVKSHETLIRKCFISIFNRFPDIEGQESIYAAMLAWFCEKDTFNQFDHSRTTGDKSEDKAWQHFVYCRIQKFLESNFFNNTKYQYRMRSEEYIDSYHRKSFSSLEKPEVTLYSKETEETHRKKNGSTKRLPRTTRINQASVYPTIDDMNSFHSSDRYGFDEEVEAKLLAENIKKQLKNEMEQIVIEGCAKGYTHRYIAKQIGRTPAAVSAMVKRIKQRCLDAKVLS